MSIAATADTSPVELDTIVAAAVAAAPALRRSSGALRAGWLRAIADALDSQKEPLVALGEEETFIPAARLRGEVARTTGQLRMFAGVAEEASYLEATLDSPRPENVPPVPDLRRLLAPLGPVAVYSASNFPFAFSVAGGDTASALAVGCPVIVKAHPGHPRLSAAVAALVADALETAGAPAGAFALVAGFEAGAALVAHPGIRAAAFTGSLRGGRALLDLAAARPDPIPFYGEFGSLNPVLVTPGADAARAGDLAQGLADSFQLGLGQLCTKPGLVFVPAGGAFERELASLVAGAPGRLLTDAIADGFRASVGALDEHPGVRRVAGATAQPSDGAAPVVYATDVATLIADDDLLEERFGPTTLLVAYDELADAVAAAERLGGSLTATLHAEAAELDPALVDRLGALAGRVLFAGWPTGVAVTWGQTHGGPWPATNSLFTSVGATAVRRFLRPVTYQSAPQEALPAELRDGNPLGIPRRVDGRPE
jgi:NADP-dependent aldehyde dehydrogenase